MSYRPITDVWFLARAKLQDGRKYYGAYLGGFPERARALLAATINEPVLHVCGGMAKHYPYAGGFGPNDRTLDLDPETEPDFLQDVRGPLPRGFKAMLADPPYSAEDAKHYRVGESVYPSPNLILRNMLDAVEPGGRVGIIHYLLPQPRRERASSRPSPSCAASIIAVGNSPSSRGAHDQDKAGRTGIRQYPDRMALHLRLRGLAASSLLPEMLLRSPSSYRSGGAEMSASNCEAGGTTLIRSPKVFKWGFAAGLDDVRRGLPFRPEYETAPVSWQFGYEAARLVATNLRAAGHAVPIWRGDLAEAATLESKMKRVAAAIGPALPGRPV